MKKRREFRNQDGRMRFEIILRWKPFDEKWRYELSVLEEHGDPYLIAAGSEASRRAALLQAEAIADVYSKSGGEKEEVVLYEA